MYILSVCEYIYIYMCVYKVYFNTIRRIILFMRIARIKLDTVIRVTGTMENLRRMKNFKRRRNGQKVTE